MTTHNGERILVADDDAMSRRLLQRALQNAGYICRETPDGTQALQTLREEIPSLMLLDFEMPGMNGLEVVRRVRADANPELAQLPVIMLTGHGGEESEVHCLEAGADDFVTKPINQAVLRARIETQLRLHSMRRQLKQQNDQLEAWRTNTERDLEAARLTQQSLIPQRGPALEGWDVAAAYRPVIQVGGDIYGWFRLHDGGTLFWIADATGHGASAALLTTLAKLLFQHGSAEHNEPAAIMRTVNSDFRSIFGARNFMTAMCVAVDAAGERLSVVGAGHPPLLIGRRNGSNESIFSSAPPLGLVESGAFVETTIEMAPGDAFFLYTDGLCGPELAGRERITPARLGEMLNPRGVDASEILQRVMDSAMSGDGERPLADDVAAIVAKRSE